MEPPPPVPFRKAGPSEATLLYRLSGTDPSQPPEGSLWGNLGYWGAQRPHGALAANQPVTPYPHAAADLASRVLAAAGVGKGSLQGQRVLFIGCGAGAELLHAVQHHGVSLAVGVEADAHLAAKAQGHRLQWPRAVRDRCCIVHGSALNLHAALASLASQRQGISKGNGGSEPFDAVVSIDAAYHFSPRAEWLRSLQPWIKPGGRLAYTDLVMNRPGGAGLASRVVLQAASKLTGINLRDLRSTTANQALLTATGYGSTQAETLSAEVLDGFAAFVLRHSAALARAAGSSQTHPWAVAWRETGWRRVAATASLITALRPRGLGYALFSGVRPAGN
jgi:SAM-dependent methyltransferase